MEKNHFKIDLQEELERQFKFRQVRWCFLVSTETCSISKSQGHAEANEWLSHVPWTHMDLFLVLTTSKS